MSEESPEQLRDRIRRASAEASAAQASAARARAEADAAVLARDEFLATLSHELRTPLNAIFGWIHLLKSGQLDPATAERGLDAIERNAREQARLVAEMLDLAQIVTGRSRLELRPIDLRVSISEAVDAVRPAADARGLALRVTIGEGSHVVAGDPDRLRQVVWHLLSNAIRFTPPGGEVHLRVERGEHERRIVVEDTGDGIEPDLLPHVFARFRQGDSSSTRRHGGLGVGLAMVRHVVEMHGGSVQAESGGRGRGARFTVHLPLAKVRRTEATDSPTRPRAHGLSPRM